jgi:hypothetical protein
MNKIISKIKIVCIICVMVLFPLISNAQMTKVEVSDTVKGSSASKPLISCDVCTAKDFFNLITDAIDWVFAFVIFVVVFMFVYAGFLLITNNGDMNKIKKARNIFTRTIVGFLIMFGSFLLVKYFLTNIGLNSSVKSFFEDIIK